MLSNVLNSFLFILIYLYINIQKNKIDKFKNLFFFFINQTSANFTRKKITQIKKSINPKHFESLFV